jgi:hypothetical protein
MSERVLSEARGTYHQHPAAASLPCLFRLYILLTENTNVYTTSLSLRSNEKWFDILYFVITSPLERFIFGSGVELGDRCRFHTGGSRMCRLCPVSGGACRFEKEHRLSAQSAFTELQSYFGWGRGEEKKKRTSWRLEKKNGRVLAGLDYLSESWVKARRERSPLIGRPMREQNAKNKTGTPTSPRNNSNRLIL